MWPFVPVPYVEALKAGATGFYKCEPCDVSWKGQDNGKPEQCWVCGRFGRKK